MLSENGLEPVAVYDAFAHEPPTEKSERVCVVARECLKDSGETIRKRKISGFC